tara:strand:- start:9766 stop:10371 length:606 start_codon:yes stop_codon:yes gene_type:complete
MYEGLSKAQAMYLDDYFRELAKNPDLGSELASGFVKAKGTIPRLFRGGKPDLASTLTSLAGAQGLIQFGGSSSKPFLTAMSNLAKTIDPVMGSTSVANMPQILKGSIALSKPGLALSTAPVSYAASGLDSLLGSKLVPLMKSNPKTALLLAAGSGAMALPAALKKSTNALQGLATARRVKQLQKGIAPKKYRGIAQTYGLK